MIRLFKHPWIALLALVAFLAGFLWLGFDRMLDGVVRPWLVSRAAAVLEGEVRLDRLELGWGRLEVAGAQVARSGEFRLRVEGVTIRFTLAGLWRRQLEEVAIRRPELEWEGGGAAGGEPHLWPSQPPLRVDAWSVEDGHLLLTAGKERLLLRQLAARGGLDTRFTVEVAAVLGVEPGVALAFSGHGRWEGRPELTITELRWEGHPLLQEPVTLAPGAESLQATLAMEQLNAAGASRLLAALEREPPWPPELGWEVTAPRLTVGLDGERLSLHLATAAGKVRRQGERWPWESLDLKLAGAAGAWAIEGEAGLPAQARLLLAGTWSEERFQGDWRLRVPDALRLLRVLDVAVPVGTPNLQELELRGKMAVAGGRLRLPSAEVYGRLAGTGLAGRVSGRLRVRQLAAGWRFEVTQLAATELEYLAPDGLSGVAGGSLQLTGTLAWQNELLFDLRGEAAAGEALAGSWYADLDGLPLGLAMTGGWVPEAERTHLHSARLDLAGLVTANLQGNLTGGRLELNGEIEAPRLDGPFQQLLRQLGAGIWPGLERLDLTGGLTAQGSGGWSPAGWEIEAAVRPAGVTLAWGEVVRLSGLTGELPLLLRRGAVAPATERLATLGWDELRAGPIASTDGRLRLAAEPNRWRLNEALRLEMGGGWLELSALAVVLLTTGPEVQASLKMAGVELAEVAAVLGWPEMGGQLGAELPDIRFADEAISSGGEALLQVFGGEVRLRNMRLRKPFSPYPTYHADIDFTGIDLHLLTQAFAFGEMNGVADGFIHDLRLFGPVPSAFNAAFETRERGKRNISVKALRNLNTLSQGGLSAALSQGIYRFIDFYRYRKIGIRCSLRNDVFQLEGTAKPGTDTYLIYGGWLPPRIDVIVSTPTISFHEMVRRLKRIERAGR